MVSPTVESVTFRLEKPLAARLGELKLYKFSNSVDNPPTLISRAPQIDGPIGEITFQLDMTVASDKSSARWRGSAPGLFVIGVPGGQDRELRATPTVHSYMLGIQSDSAQGVPPAFTLVDVKARNSITGTMIDSAIVNNLSEFTIAPPEFDPAYAQSYSEPDGLRFSRSRLQVPSKELVWRTGTIEISENTVIDKDTLLRIEPGTIVKFDTGKSLLVRGQIIAEGTVQAPIVFHSKGASPWGVVAVHSPGAPTSVFKHCVIDGGQNASVDGVDYVGALSIYYGDATIEDCLFQNNLADDALNAVYANTSVSDSLFLNNNDGIDYDFSTGQIHSNTFRDSKNDAVDISHSNVRVTENFIFNSGDKGVSIGEKSTVLLFDNVVAYSDIGIAVKDLSDALILNSTISENRIGVALYQKKEEFGPSNAVILNSIAWGNQVDIESRDGSSLTVQFSNVRQEVGGGGNLYSDPLFLAPEAGIFDVDDASKTKGAGNGRNLSEYLPGGNLVLNDIGHVKSPSDHH